MNKNKYLVKYNVYSAKPLIYAFYQETNVGFYYCFYIGGRSMSHSVIECKLPDTNPSTHKKIITTCIPPHIFNKSSKSVEDKSNDFYFINT